jgi:hypothetical protein
VEKCCLGTSFVLGLLAVACAAIALAQPFWYGQTYNASGSVLSSANNYVGLYYGTEEIGVGRSDKDLILWSSDSAWKWYDVDDSRFDDWNNWDKCETACKNGVAWGTMGIIATAPAALICILTCCAKQMGCMGKFGNMIAIGCLSFATLAFMISPAVVAGECADFNKEHSIQKGAFFAATSEPAFGDTTFDGSYSDLEYGWSMVFMVVALFLVFISLICYVIFYCRQSSKEKRENEDEQMAKEGPAAGQI